MAVKKSIQLTSAAFEYLLSHEEFVDFRLDELFWPNVTGHFNERQ